MNTPGPWSDSRNRFQRSQAKPRVLAGGSAALARISFCIKLPSVIVAELVEALRRTVVEGKVAVKPMSLLATDHALGRRAGPPCESVRGFEEAGHCWINVVKVHVEHHR